MTTSLFDFVYLISIVLFIVGLKRLSSPDSARNGNLVAASGMGLAILVSLIYPVEGGQNYGWVAGGIVLGSAIGITAAKKVQMTAMPEMVSLFNGLGGACALMISLVEFYNYPQGVSLMNGQIFTTLFALFIGSVSFTGSLVAYGKLQGFLRDSLKVPFPSVVNGVLLLTVLVLIGYIMQLPTAEFSWALIFMSIALVYGVTFVTPIGGGDMPVVISLLNSFTGVGAALAGLIYDNQVMLVGGILVGASGTILTILMCQAMNRSLFNVIIGGFSSSSGGSSSDQDQTVKEVSLSDLAIELKYAGKVMVVPGYGMAVAQAQHTVHELESMLEAEGVDFKYAIHPVAGRMPGHMNVLLAEADVPYPKLLELEDANKELTSTDVVLVIGANDVVNPSAKDDPSSTIYGMPILEVEKAHAVIVLKRGMSTGYAGIQNPLFFGEKTRMLFGDAKTSINKLKEEVDQA